MSDYVFITAAGQPAFTTETQENDYEIDFPLGAAEPTAKVARARFCQTRADYTRPTANSTLSLNGSTFYFVDDVGFQNVRGPLLRWTRLWATIPAQWSEPASYVFTYPAYDAQTIGTQFTITAIAASGSSYVLTTGATGISGGDSIFVYAKFTRGSLTLTMTFFCLVVSASSGASVTIPGMFPGSGTFSSVSGYVMKATPGRTSAVSKIAGGRIIHDYALSSTSALDTDLPQLQPFSPTDAAANIVDALTAATTPTAAQYAAMVTGAQEIVADCVRERYMANIYVRKTRMVPAL